jgi:hypothetical protein
LVQEQGLEDQINDLADACGPLLERLAPDAFFNMTGEIEDHYLLYGQ